jgi:hypothetical protein
MSSHQEQQNFEQNPNTPNDATTTVIGGASAAAATEITCVIVSVLDDVSYDSGISNMKNMSGNGRVKGLLTAGAKFDNF